MRAMLTADIWCGEVKTHLEAEKDPQVQHRGMITNYDHPVAGRVKVVAPAVKMGATPASIDRPAPLVGEHTREILSQYGLGADVEDLMSRSILGEPK